MKKRLSMNRGELDEIGESAKRRKHEIPIVLERNKQIRSFKNTHRSFQTGFQLLAFCIHPTRHLIAVCGYILTSKECYTHIYTVEGYLVTKFRIYKVGVNSRYNVKGRICFSDNIAMIAAISYTELIRLNGYNAKRVEISHSCVFDCDGNDYLYLWNNSDISVYSHEVEKTRVFTAYDHQGTPIAVAIRGDTMAVLNAEPQDTENKLPFVCTTRPDKRNISVLTFSISNEQLLESVKFNNKLIPFPLYTCLDPLYNVLIGNSLSVRLGVWYRGGRLRCYRTPDANFTKLDGLEMTDDFQIIRSVNFCAAIRVYGTRDVNCTFD